MNCTMIKEEKGKVPFTQVHNLQMHAVYFKKILYLSGGNFDNEISDTEGGVWNPQRAQALNWTVRVAVWVAALTELLLEKKSKEFDTMWVVGKVQPSTSPSFNILWGYCSMGECGCL